MINTQRKNIEHHIGQLGAVLSICFVLMALGLGYWCIIRASALAVRDDNPRQIENERRIRRGHILDQLNRPLVLSEPGALGTWNRVYLAPEAAPVVGYYTINHGAGGIESTYDVPLRGERPLNPVEQFENRLLHRYSTGVSVTLTIDRDVQQAASQALVGRSGAVVVLNAQNGDILALVSRPTFDPNTLEEDWPQLQFDPSKPLLNRAAQGLYPPGAIFETVVLAAAFDKGLATPTTAYTDELGVVITVDPPISCPGDLPQTHFTLSEAYAWPCSVLFARLGLELGGEQLADYATRLGIGKPISLPVQVSTGQLLERGMWSDLLAARTAMGQGEVLVTPLEMALVTAIIANDGVRPTPRLVLAVGEEAMPPAIEPRPVLSAEVAQHIQRIMRQAFQVNHAQVISDTAAIEELLPNIAGQAGSAESGRAGAPPHAWFIGFISPAGFTLPGGLMPAEQPRYAIAVIVEYGGDGWQVAMPVAAQILAHINANR